MRVTKGDTRSLDTGSYVRFGLLLFVSVSVSVHIFSIS